jgi:hypothetical protein
VISLPALAEENDVLPGEDVLQIRQHRFEADNPGKASCRESCECAGAVSSALAAL